MDVVKNEESKLRFFSRSLLALYLLIAIYLKLAMPAESALMVAGYGIPSWILYLVSQVELAVAFTLIFNIYPKISFSIAIGLFVSFTIFSLYRATSGAESCDCFGALVVNPWITSTLDLVAICILIAIWPRQISQFRFPSPIVVLAYVFIAIMIGWQMVLQSPNGVPNETREGVTAMQGIVILEPEKWLGNPLPIANLMLSKHDLASIDEREWILFFYHNDCSQCIEALPKYALLSKTKQNVLLVEVPPFGDKLPLEINNCLSAYLDPKQNWFIQTPIEIQLIDGIVKTASLDLPSVANKLHE